ncbi:MAG: SGNH/GDSL hydrolase family protein [Rikenellaceae bacterium]
MNKKIITLTLSLLTFLFAHSTEREKHPIFESGDNVCFVGNSITHGGHYIQYVMQYYITRYPDMRLYFKNLGISSDTADGLLLRMNNEILSSDPDVVTLMIGMNDINRDLYSDPNKADTTLRREVAQTFEIYKDNLTQVNQILEENSRELILFTPSIYDQTSTLDRPNEYGVNDGLYAYGEYIKGEAPKYGAHVVDMWSATNDINKKLQEIDPKASFSGGDRIHPFSFGGFIMATKFLEDLGEHGVVSALSIDLSSGVNFAENSELSNLELSDHGVTFDLLSYSLPFTQDKKIVEANKFIDFQEVLNSETIQITGLKEGRYTLKIDNQEVGEYSSEELALGINLSTNPQTPQYQQSARVAELCEQLRATTSRFRNLAHVEHILLRGFEGLYSPDKTINHLEELVKTEQNSFFKSRYEYYIESRHDRDRAYQEILNLQDECYEVAQPLPHHYQIIATKQ